MKERYRVVIADVIADELEPERGILDELAEVDALDAENEEELVGRIEDADAVMVYHCVSITRQTIERLEHCKLIVRGGVGYDNVDRVCAREHGIAVCNVPDYGTEEVADSAIGMMLAMTRGMAYLNSVLRPAPAPWTYTLTVPLQRLQKRVFGIVGLGRIGTAAARRAQALGMDVAFYDPYKEDGYEKSLGIKRYETLEELLEQAFVLTVHCPLTPETHRLIDAAALARMPQGAHLINTARGAVVHTGAVAEAIASGQLAGAAIDVLEDEAHADDDPLVVAWRDPEHPAHHRVLLTPHSAFYSEQSLLDLRLKMGETCRRALLDQPLRNVVNA